ncbi:DUF4244 domain-containing protein [Glutamicibacter protophormiae]|uniref:DUF4244 domain-containing protein n=1 Tax=Glutamicibacter protophormiae TaxID=37930 RepID=UPI00195A4F4E|nr:DUF4244 domain-containing protein [Glutamicibacter protophormiae]QRQ77789.1 DUF4244 domain-containing protein [Glutamicibacter protophormiae]WPR63801.1 DUF4244 domain-containing protein [Glutamicibacter protophormiae]WPR67296.1 DUF4244 domain-containing protein [Glutamicibacter protophormiae]
MNSTLNRLRERLDEEQGSTTAEFAMVTLAAVAFAGLLISILSSGDVRGMLMGLISKALSL